MFRKSIYIAIFCIISFFNHANSEVYIYATINDEIITNHDIQKEQNYLTILNPDLLKLDDEKLFNLGKNSLINQIIKENEIKRVFNLNKKNPLVDEVFTNMFTKLKFDNENEFKNYLVKKNNYSLSEIKYKLKIEIYWNELIFRKYKELVKIDKAALKKKLQNRKNNYINEYSLSEIFFNKKKEQNINEEIKRIKKSIIEIGFNNTANIFSISESSKYGGKIGWIKEDNLSKLIYEELKKIKIGQHTKVMQINNNFLILKIEDKRSTKILIDEKKQLDQLINFEKNRQLNQFSNIFFNKVKINYSIDEK